MKNSNNPIFIIGNPYSGTTLLHRMMAYHPELAWVSKFTFSPYSFLRSWDGFAQSKNFHTWSKNDYFHFKEWIQWLVFPTPIENVLVWRNLYQIKNKKYKKKEIKNYVDSVQNKFPNKRILIKQPGLINIVDDLVEIYPNAYYLFILRDPYAYVAHEIECKSSHKNERKLYIESMCEDWNSSYQKLLKLKMDSLKIIYYEEFCKNPKKTLLELFNFCHLINSPKALFKIPKKIVCTNDKRKKLLSKLEKNMIYHKIIKVPRYSPKWSPMK